jgi:hypothetical protein
MSVLRAKLADAAEDIAAQADAFATLLEQAASRGDTARRLGLAAPGSTEGCGREVSS